MTPQLTNPLHTHRCPECDGFWEHGGSCYTHGRDLICPSCEGNYVRKETNDTAECGTTADPTTDPHEHGLHTWETDGGPAW